MSPVAVIQNCYLLSIFSLAVVSFMSLAYWHELPGKKRVAVKYHKNVVQRLLYLRSIDLIVLKPLLLYSFRLGKAVCVKRGCFLLEKES